MSKFLTRPSVSVIIPVRIPTNYLKETISRLKRQSFKDFELIVVADGKEKIKKARVVVSGTVGPAEKRNLGVKRARGQILAFLDDDSYPSKDWLENAIRVFKEEKKIIAVCGPCLTPPEDNVYQKASGCVWASWLGSGGAGTYRNRICSRRKVDDFPSVNLLVKKGEFEKTGGFAVEHWPGEDTKLCLDLVKKLGGKIIYDSKVLVFHHRRPVFLPHLKQISRYAQRRGFFAKKFPETSFRIGYLMPSFFVLGLVMGGILSFFSPLLRMVYLMVLALYLFLLLVSGFEVLLREKNFYLALLVMLAILATHVWYGLLFPLGYFKKDLGVTLHRVDKKKKRYVGG